MTDKKKKPHRGKRQGSINKRHQAGPKKDYSENESATRLSVYSGRRQLGYVIHAHGQFLALDVRNHIVGVFVTRDAAVRSFREVAS